MTGTGVVDDIEFTYRDRAIGLIASKKLRVSKIIAKGGKQ